jgi:ABC-2 type transport system ATP-binding protein
MVENAVKRYHETVALNGVSLTVDREVFGLLGANGAGKSTLIKGILGLAPLDEGRILVRGHHTGRQAIEARRVIGYLPEDLQMYERLSGWEFLSFVAGIKGVENNRAWEDDLGYFGLGDERHRLIGEYSLGMRKKVGIVAALMGSPKLVLLDEPLNGLDAESMRLLRLRIEELAAAGMTFVISSHIMGFVERICARVAILRRGAIVAQGPPAALREQAHMPTEPFDEVFLHFAL